MKRKAPNKEPPRPLTEAEKENLRKDMLESSKWAREELRKRKETSASRSESLDHDGQDHSRLKRLKIYARK